MSLATLHIKTLLKKRHIMLLMDTNRYKHGKIYKITDVGYNKCYIGSTCESLSQRMTRHRSNYKIHQNQKYGRMASFELFDEYGLGNCKIELIENYPCSSKEELQRQEGQYISRTDCVNKQVTGRPAIEYRQQPEVKEHRKEYNKEYRALNRDKLNEYDKAKYERKKEERGKKIECNVCHQLIRNDWMKRHQASIKCQSNKTNYNEHNENINI